MKEKWNRVEKAGKIRLVILAVIIAWCVYCVLGYTWELHNLNIAKGIVDTGGMGSFWVDGTDFSWITALAKVIGGGLNFVVILIVYGSYTLAMMVLCGVPILVYWFFMIRKAEYILEEETELAKNICGLGGFLSVVIGVIITKFQTRTPSVWFTLVWLLFAFVGVLLPLRRRLVKQQIIVEEDDVNDDNIID